MTYGLLGALALITFINRFAFFAQTLRYQPSREVKRFLSYSSYAILTAIWTPILFQFEPAIANSDWVFKAAGSDYLLAALLAAILTVIRVKSIIVVLLSTMVFFLLRFAI